jgi:hypothetical protein
MAFRFEFEESGSVREAPIKSEWMQVAAQKALCEASNLSNTLKYYQSLQRSSVLFDLLSASLRLNQRSLRDVFLPAKSDTH